MSKKSRRRNKKILGALGALGLGLALANRGKGTEMSNISVDSGRGGDSSSAIARKKAMESTTPEKVYQDAIMRGEKGTKYVKPNLRFGQVETKDGEIKTIRPFEDAGLTFGISNRKGLSETQKAVNRANREMSEGMLPPQLRTPGRTNITTKQGNFRQSLKDFGNFIFPKANFKSGGRVKKTKVTGIAKRGFGKALKKGKK
tara:strand:- start:115 stop:717 length:603 start_codon:yes stop_codon:yes gene_type:complete